MATSAMIFAPRTPTEKRTPRGKARMVARPRVRARGSGAKAKELKVSMRNAKQQKESRQVIVKRWMRGQQFGRMMKKKTLTALGL